MSVWWSAAGRNSTDENGSPIARTGDIYIDVVTDVNGMFSIDLTTLGVSVNRVLSHSGWVLNRTLTAATDVVNLLTVMIVEVTETVVKGVIIAGNAVTASIGSVIKPVKRVGSGIEARIKLTIVRAS